MDRKCIQSHVYPHYPFSEIKKETNMNDEIDDSLLEQEEQELLADQLHEERVAKFRLEQPDIYDQLTSIYLRVPMKLEDQILELADALLDHYVPEIESKTEEDARLARPTLDQCYKIVYGGSFIETAKRRTCSCDMQLILSSGCKCGGT